MIWDRLAVDNHNMPTVSAAMHGAGAAAAPMPADQIVVPKFSAAAEMGRQFFAEKCATCHGENAAGTEQGPPFVHKIYEPSHHADFAWVRAVRGGVQAHHWRYGNMPPVEGLTDKQIAWIVEYVRALQRANGIQ